MSAAARAIRLHFARHPATSPALFHEKTTNATGKLRKYNGSRPIELPSVRGTSTSAEGKRRDGTRKFGEVRKSEFVRTRDLWPGNCREKWNGEIIVAKIIAVQRKKKAAVTIRQRDAIIGIFMRIANASFVPTPKRRYRFRIGIKIKFSQKNFFLSIYHALFIGFYFKAREAGASDVAAF